MTLIMQLYFLKTNQTFKHGSVFSNHVRNFMSPFVMFKQTREKLDSSIEWENVKNLEFKNSPLQKRLIYNLKPSITC